MHPIRPRPLRLKPSLLLLALCAGALSACGGGGGGAPGPTVSSISISPGSPSVAAGQSLQLVATATMSDASTLNVTGTASWTSSDTAVAGISAGGLVTASATATPGQTAVMVATQGGKTATATLTISGGGGATVTSVAVTPAAPTLAAGTTLQLTATATRSDASTQDVTGTATWTSSAAGVATVSGGLVAAAGGATAGQTAVITATASGKSGTTTVTISGGGGVTVTSVAVTPQAPALAAGATVQLTATATRSDASTQDVTGTATWTTSAAGVATVSGGLVTAAGGATAGQTAVITATASGKSGATTVTVTGGGGGGGLTIAPGASTLQLGRVVQLVARSATADVTTTATWSSSNPTTILVSAAGLVTHAAGAAAGATATITATQGASTGTAFVTLAAAAPAIGPTLGNDPLLAQQWHLHNTGQAAYADVGGLLGKDIDPAPAYALGLRGKGVKVAVVDSGLEIAHEDLAANVVAGSWNFLTSSADPTSTATDGDHGTCVGGLLGSVYGNGKGGMGVAPGISLNGYNFLQQASVPNEVAALGGSSANPRSSDVWIFNQSFGTGNTDPFLGNSTVEAAYKAGVEQLRGGLGAIYVKSAGNGFQSFGTLANNCANANAVGLSCQNASMDPDNTLPYNIVAGAFNASGVRSSYSTAGSAVWVSAPGGEYGLNAGIRSGLFPDAYKAAMVTTDQSGCAIGDAVTGSQTSAFNQGASPNGGCNYTNTMNGTSSAAPVTSGAIALMLEANPTLGWRDVKHILAYTSLVMDPGVAPTSLNLSDGSYVAEPAWTTNGAGYLFHNWYGFGQLDVGAAVAMAQGYAYGQLGAFTSTPIIQSAALSVAIPDNSVAGATATLSVPQNLVVEAVQVLVAWDHPYAGDLGIELVSPAGTRSVLLPVMNGFATKGAAQMVLASNAFYFEQSAGTWTLKVVDGASADVGTLKGWAIKIHGH